MYLISLLCLFRGFHSCVPLFVSIILIGSNQYYNSIMRTILLLVVLAVLCMVGAVHAEESEVEWIQPSK